ncbi:hypothetical protein CQ12_41090 [Bradyrhizobium jicamae]|uniref:Uncharacterized protein n=1 Tax=Bradyrhizobium jicamae TaxID=280332 RepID=A0A0R3L8T7_9BRAD|nr:hypothetical protein [Bradyrhizobium jicamae]KRR04322.1 hypothetical protein CQ12_41090 [Bradyrhizobium jicamae]
MVVDGNNEGQSGQRPTLGTIIIREQLAVLRHYQAFSIKYSILLGQTRLSQEQRREIIMQIRRFNEEGDIDVSRDDAMKKPA